MPIPDAVAGPQTEPNQITKDYYPLQNAYIRACYELIDTEKSYVRNEATEEQVKQARISAETALLALKKYQATLDAKKDK